MPVETTKLPTEGWQAQIGAAAYLAVMAHPDDVPDRDQFIEAVKDWLERMAKAGRPGRPRDIDRRILRVEDNIKKRLPAVDLATRHLFAFAGADVKIGEHPLTTHRYARTITQDEAAGHFYRDVWTPAKPVLHLMIAFRNNAPGFIPEDGYGTADLIARPGWLRPALEDAERLRPLIAACDAIEVSEDEMIQLLPQ